MQEGLKPCTTPGKLEMSRSLQIPHSCDEHALLAACDNFSSGSTGIQIEIDGDFVEQPEELTDYWKTLGISIVKDQSTRDKRTLQITIVSSVIPDNTLFSVKCSVSSKFLPAEKSLPLSLQSTKS